MSFKLVAQVFDIKVGNPLRKMVLIKLADQANDDGACWPSYESIAKSCEIGRRSVITHIKWLEANSFLWVERRYNTETQKNYSNIYHLTLSKGKIPSANGSPPKETDPSAADAPPSAGDAPLGGAADAPPSAGDAPKPINEPITKPIKETIKDSSATENVEVKLTTKEKKQLLVNNLFNEWLEISGQKIKVSKKRLGHISARLNDEFTPEQIIEAMTYVATDNWHITNGHNTIEVAIRSIEQIEAKLIKAQAVKNNQGSNNANHQSADSQHQPNHFDQLRADIAAKYGTSEQPTDIRTVSEVTRNDDEYV